MIMILDQDFGQEEKIGMMEFFGGNGACTMLGQQARHTLFLMNTIINYASMK